LGAALALEAASRGLPITRLVAYEPPYTTPDDGQPSDLLDRISAAQTIAAVAPHADRRTFPGQGHGVADDVITPVLVEFLGAG
jgi:hypothetical protein